jgi:hypothetical protein
VDLKTAKLLRTLFTRGQGPMELSQPTGIKIKNNKVFVLDRGFRGIKICDLEGNPANEFKTNTSFGRLNLDVNDKEEIFVGEYTQKDNTYISVYTMKGEKVRTLAKIGSKHELDLQRSSYKIRLDNDGNIVILFYVTREIMKFDSNGNLLWEKKIKNKVLSKADHLNKDGVKRGKNETVHTSMSVFNFNISTKNNIIIGHAFGGCILDKNGNLTHLITFEPPDGLFFFAISSDQVLNIFGTQIMRLYDIKEDILK